MKEHKGMTGAYKLLLIFTFIGVVLISFLNDSKTAYPESISVQQALLQVWNECEQEQLRLHNVVGRSEQLCKHKRVIKSRLRMEDGKSRYCKDCQEWLT